MMKLNYGDTGSFLTDYQTLFIFQYWRTGDSQNKQQFCCIVSQFWHCRPHCPRMSTTTRYHCPFAAFGSHACQRRIHDDVQQVRDSCTNQKGPPLSPLLTSHSLFIEFAFNDHIEVSIQYLVHHVSRFHFVRFESNDGNCRYVLIHSSLWCNKISWMRYRHWSSRRWDCHWRPSTSSQWNPSLIVQSHWSTGCPRSPLHPIHHCPQPRWTRGMCSSQWESIARSV